MPWLILLGKAGRESLISKKISDDDISKKSMFIVSYPPYGVDDIIVNNAVLLITL